MKNKPTLIIIIVLLVLFVPMVIFGTVNKFKKSNAQEIVLNYAKSSINKIDENVNVYKKGTKDKIDKFLVNGKEYTFIEEDGTVYLYSLKDGIKVIDYQAINFYNTDIENNYLLVKREGKWGVLDLSSLKLVVPCEYDYLGLHDDLDDGILNSESFIVGENDTYSIYSLSADAGFKKISNNYTSIIYDYNVSQLLLALKVDKRYGLYDFAGNRFYDNYEIQDVRITDNYLVFIDDTNYMYIFNGLFTDPESVYINDDWNTFEVKETSESLEIYLDNILFKKIEK